MARTMSGLTDRSVRHKGHEADTDPTQLFKTMIVARRPSDSRGATQLERERFITSSTLGNTSHSYS